MHNISRLHYITQDNVFGYTHAQLAEEACMAGVDWLQLRTKARSATIWKEIALDVKKVCDKYNTKLIINDNVKLAKEIGAAGVHLGKEDMPVVEARKVLGHDYIIGGTANNFIDIEELEKAGADYIGLGPFRFTSTKEKLSPVLGLEGYRQIVNACTESKLTIPIIAIGGIQLENIKKLLDAGMYGVAVASAINTALDKEAVAKEFINEVKRAKENYGTVNNSR